ncbi:MAG TPA: hypothetical protein VE999_02315 [Gemmataceae bacterium]|nr:hypothetical protein [Gemmataceae bacterium]
MTSISQIPSHRAMAIVRGLTNSGRAFEACGEERFVRLRSAARGFYWVAADGTRVLRGDDLDEAEELQAGFMEAMARAGASRVS